MRSPDFRATVAALQAPPGLGGGEERARRAARSAEELGRWLAIEPVYLKTVRRVCD